MAIPLIKKGSGLNLKPIAPNVIINIFHNIMGFIANIGSLFVYPLRLIFERGNACNRTSLIKKITSFILLFLLCYFSHYMGMLSLGIFILISLVIIRRPRGLHLYKFETVSPSWFVSDGFLNSGSSWVIRYMVFEILIIRPFTIALFANLFMPLNQGFPFDMQFYPIMRLDFDFYSILMGGITFAYYFSLIPKVLREYKEYQEKISMAKAGKSVSLLNNPSYKELRITTPKTKVRYLGV